MMRREAAARWQQRVAYQECPASFGASFPSLFPETAACPRRPKNRAGGAFRAEVLYVVVVIIFARADLARPAAASRNRAMRAKCLNSRDVWVCLHLKNKNRL